MSACRSRLSFQFRAGRNSDETNRHIKQTLDFSDGEEEDVDGGVDFDLDSSGNDGSTGPVELPFSHISQSPISSDNSGFWDSGLGTPTPDLHRSKTISRRTLDMPLSVSPVNIPRPIKSFMDCLASDEENDSSFLNDKIPPIPPTPYTPPHKKFRSLRLYDTPHTPKSLLQRASRRVTRVKRGEDGAAQLPELDARPPTPKEDHVRNLSLDPDGPQTNVNPFSPCDTLGAQGVKRDRQAMDCSGLDALDDTTDDDPSPHSEKLALREINTSRYNKEFHELCKLGDGEFGSAFKCINRLDGCTYAIKKSKKPVAGSVYERNSLNEVYAHAVLGKHPHVVRYYSAWAENDHMYIQNEFCNGGSLADVIAENRTTGCRMAEQGLKQLLLQLTQGLKYIHAQALVHLDIKPGNVFLHQNSQLNAESGVEEDILEEDEEQEEPVTYKIGDLGHVTSLHHPQVEEGDCRYLPNEILQEEFKHLAKADIFSLALTVLEAGGIGDLPKNGADWHEIRRGHLPELPHCSKEFNDLLRSMVQPDPVTRPSASRVLQHPALESFSKKSRIQLKRELNEEKLKNETLSRQLAEAKQLPLRPPTSKSSRLIGRGFARSMSSTCF